MPDRSRSRLASMVYAAAALGLVHGSASAQAFTGRVLDESTGRAVPTVAVLLLDAEGQAVASALSDGAGRYALEIPEAGEYRLAAERFGYTPTRSPLLAVTTDRTYPVDLSVRPEPIRVEGFSVTVRNERVEDWLTGYLGVSPWSLPGFRQIQGPRLAEAIARSDDGIDMLRWLYLPAFNRPGRFCVQAYTGTGCLHVYLDGRYLPSEHLEIIDFAEVVNVLVVPPRLHLLTRRHDFAPFHGFAYEGMEYGQERDTIR
ncbi:MAG: carboxypeptidase-like regulatory domain-containing protein [Longimicrobiales bacterium]